MAEPGAGLYNDNPMVGSDRGEWERYQHQQGQGSLATPPPTMAAQVQASPPVFSQGDSVRITDGAFNGLVGIVHNIARTQDGQYSYALGDIPAPANANRVYQYLENQLELPEAVLFEAPIEFDAKFHEGRGTEVREIGDAENVTF